MENGDNLSMIIIISGLLFLLGVFYLIIYYITKKYKAVSLFFLISSIILVGISFVKDSINFDNRHLEAQNNTQSDEYKKDDNSINFDKYIENQEKKKEFEKLEEKVESLRNEILKNDETFEESKKEIANQEIIISREVYQSAKETAKRYLPDLPFSESYLVERLILHGYSREVAKLVTKDIGIDWYEQAYLAADEITDGAILSRQELIRELIGRGFGEDEARDAADAFK